MLGSEERAVLRPSGALRVDCPYCGQERGLRCRSVREIVREVLHDGTEEVGQLCQIQSRARRTHRSRVEANKRHGGQRR